MNRVCELSVYEVYVHILICYSYLERYCEENAHARSVALSRLVRTPLWI
jgi:hypothetical protein